LKRIFLPTPSPSHWQRVLADPVKHWKPGFSAMTEAACWENEADRLPSGIAKLLESSQEPQLTGLRLLAAFPEWAVELPGGDTPSCTDVLALAANEHGLVVIGVEAKVDEPFGPTLGEKRATGTSSGQLQRIGYLHGVLGLTGLLKDDVRYQLLHRTASALLTARDFHASVAVMLVHSYSTKTPPSGRADYENFCSAVHADPSSPISRVPDFRHPMLYLGWSTGEAGFRDTVLPSMPCPTDDMSCVMRDSR